MADRNTLFADGILEANVAAGVARIALAQTGGDGKPVASGQLIIPLVQLPAFANGLLTLLKQVDAKVKQQQAAAAPPVETPPPPVEGGSFRFSG